jgi:PleD family two-component response regulator
VSALTLCTVKRVSEGRAGLKVTVSIGLADEVTTTELEALVNLADERLYRAKHTGKNKIEV